jgi:hypothetical protein
MIAFQLTEEIKGHLSELATLEKAKFLLQIRPNQEIIVQCRECLNTGRRGYEARLSVKGELAASFLIFFVDEECTA